MCLIEMGMPKMGPDRKPEMGADGRPVIAWSPKPAISCATEVSEGMAVRTDSAMVQECRRGVMEFLLINHPLDCPICDQAGECKLQEFSVEFGKGGSEFLEEKVKKPKRVDIGKNVLLDDERCILCSRCIRFMKEVAKDDVLGFVQRGSHSTLTVYPSKRLDSNYSMNTVDLCPVGALTSKDFRFQMRTWFLKETKSIDVNCGNGTNIVIWSRENVVYRITPRENEEVNSCWMPDSSRLNFRYLQREDRLKKPLVKGREAGWAEALRQAAEELSGLGAGKVAILASGRSTNEELYLVSRIAAKLEVSLMDLLPREQAGDGFLIAPDGNPNTVGAIVLGVGKRGTRLEQIVEGIRAGAVEGLLCVGEDAVRCGVDPSLLGKLKSLVAIDLLPNQTTEKATVLLPGSGFAEKRGTMVNLKGRLQRLNRAVLPPGEARDDFEILAGLLSGLGGEDFAGFEAVFAAMAENTACLNGLNFGKGGDTGVVLAL